MGRKSYKSKHLSRLRRQPFGQSGKVVNERHYSISEILAHAESFSPTLHTKLIDETKGKKVLFVEVLPIKSHIRSLRRAINPNIKIVLENNECVFIDDPDFPWPKMPAVNKIMRKKTLQKSKHAFKIKKGKV